MAISFLTHTPPFSKRPFQSGKIFQHFESPLFEVESIGPAPCQYVTGTGFPPRPSTIHNTIQYNTDVYTGGIMHYKEGLLKPPVVKKD